MNRWITEVDWDAKALNQRRLELLQRDSTTHYTPHGVIAIDNTPIDQDGKLIEDAGWFWDHADQRHLIAHDYLIANYVCASGKHYRAQEWALSRLTTIGESCRAMFRESLGKTIAWSVASSTRGVVRVMLYLVVQRWVTWVTLLRIV